MEDTISIARTRQSDPPTHLNEQNEYQRRNETTCTGKPHHTPRHTERHPDTPDTPTNPDGTSTLRHPHHHTNTKKWRFVWFSLVRFWRKNWEKPSDRKSVLACESAKISFSSPSPLPHLLHRCPRDHTCVCLCECVFVSVCVHVRGW